MNVPPIRILLVDDEVIIKKVLREKVNWAQFDMQIVEAVSSAYEALDFLDRFAVDLIITDIKMPYMDGNEFIGKALAQNSNLKFLVLSAYTDFSIVRKSFKLGVYDYLQKSDINTPVMNDILIKLRNEIIRSRNTLSQECLKSSQAGLLDSPAFRAHGQYTVLRIHDKNGPMGDRLPDIPGLLKDGLPGLYVTERNADGVTLLLEHRQNSAKGREGETRAILEELHRCLVKGSVNYCIGVSSSGTGETIDYLNQEAERALGGEFYAVEGQTVFYYQPESQAGSGEEPKLAADYWKQHIREQVNGLNLNGATALMNRMMEMIGSMRPDSIRCRELVFDTYYFYISYLHNNGIVDLKEEIELDHTVISNIIGQFNQYGKLNEWIGNNLEIIKNQYLMKYRTNMVEIIKVYIALNLADDLSLGRIAEYYGVNGYYMSRLFKKEQGVSLKRYIDDVRMERAKKYLTNTNIKIKDICGLIGHDSPEHFSRIFKEKFGQSPLQYREKAQAAGESIRS